MTITEARVGDIVVLRLSGRMTIETFGSVKEAVRAHVDRGVRRLVFNLQDVPYADSIAIMRARCLI